MKSVTWKIAGEAGFGIMSSGIMLARAFTREGYHIFADNDYPSLIRGGHNVITVRIASEPFYGMNREVHVLVALNAEAVEKHREELLEGAVVFFDPHDKEWKAEDFPHPVELFPLPMHDIVAGMSADTVMRNTVTLGATIALLGASFDSLSSVIRDQFAKKGQEVIELNEKIAKAGFDYVHEHFSGETAFYLEPGTYREKLAVVNGSEALGLGAVRAGLKFAAIYPMTPINAVISFLADHAKQLKIVYKQPEDEIAGINMAIGASLSGVRSMVATSGGGFALMNEGLSLAGITETPLVLDIGMRAGPATGMPTYTEQGELLFVIHAGHGEFPRIVLAPGDAGEAFRLTMSAFELADRYQVPVFVLTDKYLNESQWCVPLSVLSEKSALDRGKLVMGDTGKPEGEFLRYDVRAEDGVSVRSTPGTKHGLFYANSYEHDGKGHVTDRADKRVAMADKRLKKVEAIGKDVMPPVIAGDQNPDILFLTWGTTKGPVISAVKRLQSQGKKAAVAFFPWIYPFPKASTVELIKSAKRVIDVEQNGTGQFAQLLRAETGIDITEKFLKYDGRPFYPEEIVEKVG